MFSAADHEHMGLALAGAQRAWDQGEVPVGAVLVLDGEVLAQAHNQPIQGHDPTAHAEIVALRQACARQGNYRLPGATVYVTLEPCAMCAMALMHARVARVVFATPDPKTGVAGSVLNLFGWPSLNHHTQVESGLRADESALLLKRFFQERRAAQRTAVPPLAGP